MHSRVTTAEVPGRNPVARSLALAVLGVALVGAAIMGGIVFVALLAFFLVGYFVSLARAWWRLYRARHRVASAVQPRPQRQLLAAKVDCIEGELVEVVGATVDAAPRGPGGTA